MTRSNAKAEGYERVGGDVRVARVEIDPPVDGQADDAARKTVKRAIIEVDMPAHCLSPE